MQRPAASRQLGVSPPISTASPDAAALLLSSSLEKALAQHGFRAEGSDPTLRRVVEDLEALVVTFIHSVALETGLSVEQAGAAGGKLCTLGSQALGVATPGADIDLLVLAPYFVERSHFFADGGLGGLLRVCDGLSGLQPVQDAFVPVIKLKLHGVAVDLLFASLKLPQVPADLSPSQEGLLLRCHSEIDVHSLNGVRVAAAIPALVPHRKHFCATLRAVKLWAQRRGMGWRPIPIPCPIPIPNPPGPDP